MGIQPSDIAEAVSWARRRGRFTPLASRSTLDELIRALGYPRFRLASDQVLALLVVPGDG